ncbi:hypothetical protein EUX98_g9011 [Antrodiella citrinella]|uniref:Uncharacterized protein n=1 Tax=Antrodiella citrinella TaxID=2447956 RepID=A0A4S4M117_9APHY|nr:hypothetical protein EUX98_g9011 [Antrodiella citrinella]
MKYVHRDLDVLRARWPKFVKQHPQCEGVTRDRLVFEDTIVDPRLFRAQQEGGRVCRIEAGDVHGIQIGTSFELYDMTDTLQKNRMLGTAVTKEVFPTYCLEEMAEGVRLAGGYHTALVLQQVYKLRFAVVNKAPNSTDALRIEEKLAKSMSDADTQYMGVLTRVDAEAKDVDVVLEIDDEAGGGVTFLPKDVHFRDLTTRSPRLDASDVEAVDFPAMLNDVAKFNFYLAQTSQGRPFVDDVDFELHLLEDDADDDGDDEGPLKQARALKEELPFKNDEVQFGESEDPYAFVLKNNGSVPLYPYIIYFDPGTYQIETWYTPLEAKKPTLLPHSFLQVGASPEHREPFWFFIREGEDVDTSFVKVFLLDAEAHISFMDQAPVMGRDEEGKSYIRDSLRDRVEAGLETAPRRGGWDSISKKITVTRQ